MTLNEIVKLVGIYSERYTVQSLGKQSHGVYRPSLKKDNGKSCKDLKIDTNKGILVDYSEGVYYLLKDLSTEYKRKPRVKKIDEKDIIEEYLRIQRYRFSKIKTLNLRNVEDSNWFKPLGLKIPDWCDAFVGKYLTQREMMFPQLIIPMRHPALLKTKGYQSFLTRRKGEPFKARGSVKGCVAKVQKGKKGTILLSESFTTAVAVANAAEGYTVLSCSGLGNLIPAATNLKVLYPNSTVILMVDKQIGNTPLSAQDELLRKQAKDLGIKYIEPQHSESTDFRDDIKFLGIDKTIAYLLRELV